MELTLQQVLDSKAYMGGGVTYKPPREYLDRFIEIAQTFSPTEWEIRTGDMVENANEDGSINTSYGKIFIKGRVRLDDEFSYSAGILFAASTQKPIIKVFSGLDVNACFNLTIFGADHISTALLTDDNFGKVYESAGAFVANRNAQYENYLRVISTLKSTRYNIEQLQNKLGYLLEAGIKDNKLGTSAIVVGAKSLFDNKSKYRVEDDATTAWNVYNAITEAMKSSDLTMIPDKTVKLSKHFIN